MQKQARDPLLNLCLGRVRVAQADTCLGQRSRLPPQPHRLRPSLSGSHLPVNRVLEIASVDDVLCFGQTEFQTGNQLRDLRALRGEPCSPRRTDFLANEIE
jgi:hypothetical protein